MILEARTGAIRRGLGEKISPKILILEHKKKKMKKYEKNNKKNENKIKNKKNNEKNISENIDPRGSGPVPFGSASQTASGGFGALSLQT